MKIDCDTCAVRGDACSDCVVSFLTIPVRPGTEAGEGLPAPLELDPAQERAIDAFARAGMVAPLRHAAG